MWGQASNDSLISMSIGIIPTRVGTRGFLSLAFCVVKDHPHACGDKRFSVVGFLCGKGSSPRVWGQEIYDKLTEMRARIIPTRVGTRDIYVQG